MSKRAASGALDPSLRGKRNEAPAELTFEDAYLDEYEEEDLIESEHEEDMEESEDEEEEMKPEKKEDQKIWTPADGMGKDEELVCDSRYYHMLHRMNWEWPCLSFDIIKDNLGDNRTEFPATAYVCAGTQADQARNNKLLVLKMADMYRTKNDDRDSDDEFEDDSDPEDDPIVTMKTIKHNGAVNRIKSMPQQPNIIGVWSDKAEVSVYDISVQLEALDTPGKMIPTNRYDPLCVFPGHETEGYALNWSPKNAGYMASGDCSGRIHVWKMQPGGTFNIDKLPYTGHEDSVEDIEWSPTEGNVFMSCSADKSIKIWDIREKSHKSKLSWIAHDTDVNVISWNRLNNRFLLSGSDDGSFKVWDLRHIAKRQDPVAHFKYHTGPITSVEWSPHEESAFAVSGADDQLTIWDLSLETDETALPEGVPPQLVFTHMGQHDMKEVHFHDQLPGVLMSTAGDGFNVLKPNFELE